MIKRPMSWNNSTISDAKDRIRQYDQDRKFYDITSDRIMPQIMNLKLGEAQELGLAIMHVDMNNFKGLSGDLPNKEKLRLLNIYQSELTYIIKKYGGVVEKYVGDGITSVFGAGNNKGRAVSNAINCALDILTEIRYVINEYLEEINIPAFTCSIGIDYGDIGMARTGIKEMNQLTLVGNEVSSAKQLEEFAGNHQIFIGGIAYRELSSRERRFCKKQPDEKSFTWKWGNNEPYPFYRYATYWPGYKL